MIGQELGKRRSEGATKAQNAQERDHKEGGAVLTLLPAGETLQSSPENLPDGFKMTELGPLPEEWQVVRLGDVCERPQYGFTAAAQPRPVGPKLLRITDIQDGKVDWAAVPYCECPRESIDEYVLRPGDILFARTGSVGKTYLVTKLPEQTIFASYLIRVRVNKDEIIPEFAYLFMQSTLYWRQIASQTHGAVQPNVNATQIRGLLLPLPPLPEQQAIAHVLRTVQEAKEATERVIAALRDLKKSLMQHLFTCGPVPLDQADQVSLKDTEIGPIPQHWQVVRLGEVCDTRSGGTPSRKKTELYGGPIPWVKSGELNDNVITSCEESITEEAIQQSNARVFPAGTLLVALYGATTGKVGILGLNAATNQAVCGIFPKKGIFTPYLFYVLIYRRDSLLQERYGGAQPNISQLVIREFRFPLPPLSEQREIARILQAVDRKMEAEEGRKRALDALFQTLLHELMSGRRRVKFTPENTGR